MVRLIYLRKIKHNICFSGDSFEFNYSNGKMQVIIVILKTLQTVAIIKTATRTRTTSMTKKMTQTMTKTMTNFLWLSQL